MNGYRKIYEKIESANVIGVTLKHNGLHGGDCGHGGFVDIRIDNLGGTSIQSDGEDDKYFHLRVMGDCERRTLIEAFKLIVKELEENE